MAASNTELDEIRISRWSLPLAIGAYDYEKLGKQEVVLDLRLWGDFRRAGRSDALEDALDYAELKASLEGWMEPRRWDLLEAFGEQLCAQALAHPLVQAVRLTVDKPAAQAPALVSYTLTRRK